MPNAPTHINPAVPKDSCPVNPVSIFKPTVANPTAKIGITCALRKYSEVFGTHKNKYSKPKTTTTLSKVIEKISLSFK